MTAAAPTTVGIIKRMRFRTYVHMDRNLSGSV